MAEGMDLGKKVGPLPLGGWIIVVGAGLVIGYIVNKNAGKKADTPTTDPNSDVGTGGGSFLPISPPSEPTETDPETNQAWGQKAIKWLIAQSIDSVVANNAVTKFLSGMTLDAQESAAIAMALGHFGPPPEGVSAPPDDPTPKTPGNLVHTGTINDRVGLSWSPVVGAMDYEVMWNTTEWGQGGPVTTTIPTISSGPHDGRFDHTFYVRAVNDFGKSQAATITVPKWTTTGTPPPPNNPPPSNPPPPPPPPPTQRTHTIAKGNTLWGISSQYYGTGTRWIQIYNANAGAIEAAAKANGKSSSRGPNGTVGWWIYPGTVLVIP